MKKFFMLLLTAALLFACSSNDEEDVFVPQLAVESNVIRLTSQAETQTLTIKSNTSWTLQSDVDWLTLSHTEGQGNAMIEMTCTLNKENVERKAIVTLKGKGIADVTIDVEQRKCPQTVALYILSEGSRTRNQAELAYYDLATATISKKYFSTQNGIPLGDTGNDLAIYGSKIYCVVSGTTIAAANSYIEIIDPATGKSQKRIGMTDADGNPDIGRKITFYKDKAYITAYSGIVARLDTATLQIDGYAKLSGAYPEGVTQYGGKLYVCNAGYGEGNTISVVDIATFKESKTITVPQNPVNIGATATGDIYFTTATLEWSTGAPSNLHLLDVRTETVTKTFDIRASALAIGRDYVYTVDNITDWVNYETFDYNNKVNLKTYEVSPFTDQLWDYFMVYNVNVNLYNGDVYIAGQGQDVAIFGADGTLKTKLKTGVGYGNSVVPIYSY